MLTYNTPTRDLDIKIALTLATGVTKQLTASEIVSYSVQEDCGSAGYVLGSAASAAYDLIIENSTYSAQMLVGATVSAQIGIKSGTSYVYSPFGVWYVDRATVSKRSATVQLFGKDALAGVFDVAWAEPTYPITIGGLAQTACDLANVDLVNSTFLNSTVSIAEAPEWPEGLTARDVISMCAACAGGFARMTREGKLEIVTYNAGDNVGNVTEDTLFVVESGNGQAFGFNCLAVRKVGEEDFTRYTVTEAADSAANTLQIDGNPLMTTDAMANAIKTALTGFASEGITARWIGDPSVRLGDKITFDGSALICNSQSFTFEGGLYAETACELSEDTATSSGYTARDLAITASGMVQGSRIVNESITTNALAANTVTAGKIAAGSVTTDKLDAGCVTTSKLAAGAVQTANLDANSVTADKLDADSVTTDKIASHAITSDLLESSSVSAFVIDAVSAKFEEIATGSLTTDELYASMADIVTLMVGEINADNITTDQLAAVLGDFVKLYADTAGIDYADIKDLVSDTAIITQGEADQLYIARLAVTEANMVSLSVGELIITGEDGNMYALTVDDAGNVSTSLRQITNKDLADHSINAGEKIISGSITADLLNVQQIFASEALINSIKAANLDVADLFASEAFIASLNAWDIWSNDYMQLSVKKSDMEIWLRIDPNVGVEIGKSDSTVKNILDNESWRIQDNGVTTAECKGGKLTVSDGQFTGNIILGDFLLRYSQDNGHVSLLKA